MTARRTPSAFRGCLLGGAVADALELQEEIAALADDLLVGSRDDAEWHECYPGW